MKINSFVLEAKLHKLNKALLDKNSEVVFAFNEIPERAYEARFTFEFVEDLENLIAESKDIVIVIEYEHSWRGSLQSDYVMVNYNCDWDLLWNQLTWNGGNPTKYYVFNASDNPLDHELLYKMIKAAEATEEGKTLPIHQPRRGRPIEEFPFFPKKSVDPTTQV